jgi:hypothetical protein
MRGALRSGNEVGDRLAQPLALVLPFDHGTHARKHAKESVAGRFTPTSVRRISPIREDRGG